MSEISEANLPDYGLHAVPHRIAVFVETKFGEAAPEWLHFVVHTVLFWVPVFLLVLACFFGVRLIARRVSAGSTKNSIHHQPSSLFRYVLHYSRREQAVLVAVGLLAMPILYVTLELPKIIINTALDDTHFPDQHLGITFQQTEFLIALCLLYLVALLMNGAVKFWINIRKGKTGERLLRRLRLTIFRRWRLRTSRNTDVVPLIAQEVEPLGGFAADAFALPVFQGGTFLTILLFMFIQDPVLGAAALTMLPVQIIVIPRLQRQINVLARLRIAEIRQMSKSLGDIVDDSGKNSTQLLGGHFKNVHDIRLRLHRIKFFMKALNNFLTALTPFFFYSLGGFLVIKGDLTLGALVAVLAAYKDFSAPLKELFRYYQASEDARVRYDDLLTYLEMDAQKAASTPDERSTVVSPYLIGQSAKLA
tara:strand:+ start:937 stop:2196 length:1260 start_codon:yes stop_codon:yes gene_type:complete